MTKDDDFGPDERRALASWKTGEPPEDFAARLVAQAQAEEARLAQSGSRRERVSRARHRLWAAVVVAGVALSGGSVAVAEASAGGLLSAYVGCLLFGGILLVASLFGGHGVEDAGHGDVDHGGDHGGHDHHGSHEHQPVARTPGYLPLLSLRFWVFALTFFGLTGVVLEGLNVAPPLVVALVAMVIGMGAGYGAGRVFRRLMRDTVGELPGPDAHIGREGSLLLPVARGQRGKVRFAAQGGQVDMLAETDSAEALPPGTTVLIVGMRGSTAIVERSPGLRNTEEKNT